MGFPYSPGDVLTAADLNEASGLVLVKTQTVGSGVSSVTVTGAFSATFDNYLITDNGGTQSVDTALMFFFGSTQTGTDYYQSLSYVPFTTGTPTGVGHSLRSEWVYCGGSSGMRNAHITVMNPGVANFKNMHAVLRYGTVYGTATGYYAAATAQTSFTFKPAAGTMSGGVIRVYGYNNG
jgi:hypothetical protein